MQFLDLPNEITPKMKCVGKVVTSQYKTKTGFAYTRKFIVLKSKSQLSISDFCDYIEEYLPINFLSVKDGVYELTSCNFSRDFETGAIDDWDIQLTPYVEPTPPEEGK